MVKRILIFLAVLCAVHGYLLTAPMSFRLHSPLTRLRCGGESKATVGDSFQLENNPEIMQLRDKIKNLNAKIPQIKKEINKTRDNIAEMDAQYGPQIERIKDEFDRMKERSNRGMKIVVENTKVDALKEILPIWDNYFRVRKDIQPQTTTETEILKAYDEIFQQFEKEIVDFGLTKIETVGKPFDYHMMHCVMKIPSAYPENIVCQELQVGYKIGDRCVRPARVAVASGEPWDFVKFSTVTNY